MHKKSWYVNSGFLTDGDDLFGALHNVVFRLQKIVKIFRREENSLGGSGVAAMYLRRGHRPT